MHFESIDAYRHILPSLSKARRKVMEYLLEHGASTGREVNRALTSPSGHKRISELSRLGMIRSAGTRICKISGLRAAIWGCCPSADINPKARLAKAPTRNELELNMGELLAENSSLKREIERLQTALRSAGRQQTLPGIPPFPPLAERP